MVTSAFLILPDSVQLGRLHLPGYGHPNSGFKFTTWPCPAGLLYKIRNMDIIIVLQTECPHGHKPTRQCYRVNLNVMQR